MKKFRRSFPTFLAAALLWGGCAGQGDEEVTTLHVSGGGKLEQVIVEPESGDTFTEEELREYIEDSLAVYEETAGENRVELKSCSLSGGTARIEMEYASAEDYAAYNRVECFQGTVQEAESAGYSFDRTFVDSGGNAAEASALLSRGECSILIVEEFMEIKLPGTVLYTTDNASVSGKKSVSVVNAEDSGDSFAQFSEEPVYIIYQ